MKKRSISRRGFLKVILSVTLISWSYLHFIRRLSPERHLYSILEKHLGYLQISTQDKAQFINEYLDQYSYQYRIYINEPRKAWWKPPINSRLSIAHTKAVSKFESELINTFLLSTDLFFKSKRDSQISYLALYNPYVIGCHNPFANLS